MATLQAPEQEGDEPEVESPTTDVPRDTQSVDEVGRRGWRRFCDLQCTAPEIEKLNVILHQKLLIYFCKMCLFLQNWDSFSLIFLFLKFNIFTFYCISDACAVIISNNQL